MFKLNQIRSEVYCLVLTTLVTCYQESRVHLVYPISHGPLAGSLSHKNTVQSIHHIIYIYVQINPKISRIHHKISSVSVKPIWSRYRGNGELQMIDYTRYLFTASRDLGNWVINEIQYIWYEQDAPFVCTFTCKWISIKMLFI